MHFRRRGLIEKAQQDELNDAKIPAQVKIDLELPESLAVPTENSVHTIIIEVSS